MSSNIDIVSIGEKKVEFQDKDNVEFESLGEYYNIARKIICAHAPRIKPGLAQEMLNNEDAVCNVAHVIMMADWRFNGNGTRHGYRKQMAIYAIYNYISRAGSKQRCYSLDDVISDNTDNSFMFITQNVDNDTPDQIAERKEQDEKAKQKVKEILTLPFLSDRQIEYLKDYFLKGLTLKQIGKKRGVSRQSVHEFLGRTFKQIRQYYEGKDTISI